MKEIKLSQGMFALVDDEDYCSLSKHYWCVAQFNEGYSFYAVRSVWKGGKKMIRMHRQILGVTDPKIKVDHIDGNGLNNQRINLRLATHSQNCANRRTKKGKKTHSQFLGVMSYNRKPNQWIAVLKKDGNIFYLGRFSDERDAALAYNKAAIEHHGEFARLNKL